MKNVYLLGATGSIGKQVLDIIDNNPLDFQIVTLTANTDLDGMSALINKYHPKYVAMGQEEAANILRIRHPQTEIGHDTLGLIKAATLNPEDHEGLLVNALVGMCGLVPTIKAVEIGRSIALANKETLVIGGDLIMPLAKKHHVNIFPIDSEHSAIWQCLHDEDINSVKNLIITASGGAFRDLSRDQLESVTAEAALKHPNWSMGAKITIDCATMINKGFEVIEAHHLFGLPITKIKTILHKESYVHSLVEFIDGSIIAQMAEHDMRIPISYALFYPQRKLNSVPALSLSEIGKLSFAAIDLNRYPCLGYAYEALEKGGLYPCVLNAANEAAVQLFIEHKIAFLDIETIIRGQMDHVDNILNPTLEDLLKMDASVKEAVFITTLK
ncbi:MAG: 1-deoxy-D-xylulose-5-phosphate reductoisomerase [Candidatus Izemoplasmatales bacterium]|jgi:1-deoxy-D-xylulose-5-phosphate reductoisomerase